MRRRIAINGFGRIGRLTLRAALAEPQLDIVAVNDVSDAATLAHLLEHDSVHGTLARRVRAEDDQIKIQGVSLRVFRERNPERLPWGELDVAVVLECTGRFRRREEAAAHLRAGAKKVIISAPGKGADVTICYGVNESAYRPEAHHVISNASCTTNSVWRRCESAPGVLRHPSWRYDDGPRVYKRSACARCAELDKEWPRRFGSLRTLLSITAVSGRTDRCVPRDNFRLLSRGEKTDEKL